MWANLDINKSVEGMKSKVYAVAVGRTPGIYNTWAEAKQQVDKFPRARHKSFSGRAEAAAYLDRMRAAAPAHQPKQTDAKPRSAGSRKRKYDFEEQADSLLHPPLRTNTACNVEEGTATMAVAVQPTDSLRHHVLTYDGGARGNPGPAGCGAVLSSRNVEVGSVCVNLGHTTNNVAEYTGMLTGLKAALLLGVRSLDVYGDSKLVTNQMTGKWQCRHANLVALHREALEIVKNFEHCTFRYIPRTQNAAADRLANKAMDGADWEGLKTPDGKIYTFDKQKPR